MNFVAMTRIPPVGLVTALCTLVLAGCGSAPKRPDYSSLPPAPHHTGVPAEIPTSPVPATPTLGPSAANQTAQPDVLDRIRAGFALDDVNQRAVDRELDRYLSQP